MSPSAHTEKSPGPAWERELYREIVDESSTGVYVCQVDTYELLYVNRRAREIGGLPHGDLRGKKCYEVIAGLEGPCAMCWMREMTTDGFLCREFTVPRSGRVLEMRGKLVDWHGARAHIEYVSDITARKQAEERLAESERSLATAIDHAQMQYWEYDPAAEAARISQRTQRLYGLPPELRDFPESFLALGLVHPEHREAYREMYRALQDGERECVCQFRIRTGPGEPYRWVQTRGTNVFDSGGRPVKSIFTEESIAQYKELEQRFDETLSQAGVMVWSYDLRTRRVTLEVNGLGLAQDIDGMEDVPDSILAAGALHPDDRGKLSALHERLFAGERTASEVIRWRMDSGDEYWWAKIIYNAVEDRHGRPVRAIGTAVDVSEQMLLEARYDEEQAYIGVLQENTIRNVRADLTQNTLEKVVSSAPYCEDLPLGTFDQLCEAALAALPEEERSRREVRDFYSRRQLLRLHDRGEQSCSVEYGRLFQDGLYRYVRASARLRLNPTTHHVHAFLYTQDITGEKRTQLLVHKAVEQDYDYIAYIDTVSDTFSVYRNEKSAAFLPPKEGRGFEEATRRHVMACVVPEDQERVIWEKSLANVLGRLEREESCQVFYTAVQKDGSLGKKKLRFSYIDRPGKKLLLTEWDVTDVYNEEQRRSELLKSALAAAEAANRAKSDFLSRMSHEIRTPMNAILGMTAMAREAAGENSRAADCLDKIDLSSRFLLSLIGDILDMSRIESGKVQLRREPLSLEGLIAAVGAICRPQAEAKGVEYRCAVEPSVGKWYMGDPMKLQQVLVNILGNGVKFTPAGGRVSLAVSQPGRRGDRAVLRFVADDTGCGVSGEFLPHIFEPFAQEQSGSTAVYGGTGLGLAICKNLVEMMDGQVTVESHKGRGSRFVVEVLLEPAPDQGASPAPGPPQGSFDFGGKRVLLCEDHPLNVEVAKNLLTRKGFAVETAENGLAAVEKMSASPPGWYDLILMDIRMPVMDGLAAAQSIRRLDRPDAAAVPIVAMTANAFAEDVEKSLGAGMNAHLAKPIDPALLYRTLAEQLARKEEKP